MYYLPIFLFISFIFFSYCLHKSLLFILVIPLYHFPLHCLPSFLLKLTSAYPARLARSIWQRNLLCVFIRFILVFFFLSCYWHPWSKIIILILLHLLSHLNSIPILITIFFFSLRCFAMFPLPSLQDLFSSFQLLESLHQRDTAEDKAIRSATAQDGLMVVLSWGCCEIWEISAVSVRGWRRSQL